MADVRCVVPYQGFGSIRWPTTREVCNHRMRSKGNALRVKSDQDHLQKQTDQLNCRRKEGHTCSPTWQTSSHPVTTGYGSFLSWALLFPFLFPVDDGTPMVELRLMRQACSPAAAAAANFLRAGMSTWGNAVDIVMAWIRWQE